MPRCWGRNGSRADRGKTSRIEPKPTLRPKTRIPRARYGIQWRQVQLGNPDYRVSQNRETKPMQLYVTHFSPFARMARVVLREKKLENRVEEIPAATRKPNSNYYQINPSGRVPYLICDDGIGIEGSQPVCYYLDHLDGLPVLHAFDGEVEIVRRRLEEYARSVVDGASVWVRELARPPQDRSATIIEHERQRLNRLADFWEREIDHPLMHGDFNMPQLTLACGLLLEEFYPGLQWREGRPRLAAWADLYAERPSFIETRPEGTIAP